MSEGGREPAAAPQPCRTLRARRWARRLGLAAGALLAAALLAEGAVRIAFGEQPKFPRYVVGAPFGLRVNVPNARYRHRSADVDVEFRINARGMRADRDYPYEKPAGVRRVVSLGDSFTVGYEVDVEDCFSSVLERELRARGLPVEVMNAGVSGYGTAEACLYLERELLRYEPDLVLVSFCGNDFADNVRSDLFRLEGDRLVEGAPAYVPYGGFADHLNRNRITRFLSERSDAFAWCKERLTLLLKRRLVEENLSGPDVTAGGRKEGASDDSRRLAAALFERLYSTAQGRGIPLLIHSIPFLPRKESGEVDLVDSFPYEAFAADRPGLDLVATKPLLDPHVGHEPLYFLRSHFHWTPFSHSIAGKELARVVWERGFLRP